MGLRAVHQPSSLERRRHGASTSELNAEFPVFTRRIFRGSSRKTKFQIEGTRAFILNKQTAPGSGSLKERHWGRRFRRIDSYGVCSISKIAAAKIAAIQANTSVQGITFEYVHAEGQSQRFHPRRAHLAKSTIKRAGVPPLFRVGAEFDAEVCSKHDVGR
jgi:hypothetical protein